MALLLQNGAGINAQDLAGKTPLMLAMRGNKYQAVKVGGRLSCIEIDDGTRKSTHKN